MLTVLFSFLCWKTKFKIDRSGLVTLVIYLFSALITALEYVIPTKSKIVFLIISIIRSSIVCFAFYYFTFEMKLIETSVKADKIEDVEKVVSRIQKVKWVFIGILVVIFGPLYSVAVLVESQFP